MLGPLLKIEVVIKKAQCSFLQAVTDSKIRLYFVETALAGRGITRFQYILSVLILTVGLISFGCERDALFIPDEEEIIGYQIEGTVTDQVGTPIRNVPIVLFYEFGFMNGDSPPSKEFQVTDPNKIIRVVVMDRSERVRRVLFEGRHSTGTMIVEWDLKDTTGALAPSGVYLVQYIVSGQVEQSYPVTVDGTVTAYTDSVGKFVIQDEQLPVGFYPVPLYTSDSTYLGIYSILPYATVQARVQTMRRSVYLTLTKNSITRADIKF